MKKLSVIFSISTLLLAGCNAGPQVKSYVGPTGEVVSTVRCTRETSPCFVKASEQCGGGEYKVTNSYRNAGGLFADILPGPVTWYTMSIVCGKSDGVMPQFPLRGEEPKMPPMPQPSQTNTSTKQPIIKNSMRCTSQRMGTMVHTNCN